MTELVHSAQSAGQLQAGLTQKQALYGKKNGKQIERLIRIVWIIFMEHLLNKQI